MIINKERLPIKAHYFFFMAGMYSNQMQMLNRMQLSVYFVLAMGPILPQLSVFGKQLGISTIVMGSVTGILPILFLIAKPLFGFLVDKFRQKRKIIFISLVVIMGIFYALIHFVEGQEIKNYNLTCSQVQICNVS